MKPIITFLLSLTIATTLLAQPVISSFSPAKGVIGSTVTITGTKFNATAAQNIVFFGDTKATVKTATVTRLTVAVPPGATYKYISVTNLATALTAYSAIPFTVTLAGSINFTQKVDFATGMEPYSISTGDIDGDGKPDLVITNLDSNTISVLRNTSTAGTVSFAKKVDFATGITPYFVSIADIDGDGKPDLAEANWGGLVYILRNTSTPGTISFAGKVGLSAGGLPLSISIGDIDGDGKPDLAVTNYSTSSLSVLRNTSTPGTISFADPVYITTGTRPRSVSIGDIDGDGKPDLAVANAFDSTVSVLRNTSIPGTISFAGRVNFATGSLPHSVSLGDIDGDGRLDLAVANANSYTVSILRNTSVPGSISFATSVNLSASGHPWSITIGDIDGDGKPDLAVVPRDSTVSVFKNTSTPGNISFAGKVDLTIDNPASGEYGSVAVSIGDLDGDGRPDLTVVNQNSNTVSVILQCASTFSINSTNIAGQTQLTGGIFRPVSVIATGSLLSYQWYSNTTNSNNGGTTLATANGAQTNSYTPQTTVAGTLYYYCMVTGGCGQPLTTAVSGAFIVNPVAPTISNFLPLKGIIGSTVTITGTYFNTTPAQNIVFFGATKAIVKAATATSLTVTVPVGATYQYISVTNLAKGLTAYSAQPFLVTLTGSINFAPKIDSSTGLQPWSISTGDMDGDGKPDLIITNAGSNTVSVLRNTSNTGNISFAKKVDFTTGSGPRPVRIGDIDGDGKPDLAIANAWDSTVSILRNTSTPGTISFAAKIDFKTGSLPNSLSISDIDGDGKPDLAVANGNSNALSLLRNTSTPGNISFAAKVDFVTDFSPYSVSIGDIDGDGKPDLAVANIGNTVYILRNISIPGSIRFVKVDISIVCYSISMGDVDGDGKLDLVLARPDQSMVSILRNTSTPGAVSFAAQVDLVTTGHPWSINIGDIDGDGKPDLAIVSEDSTLLIFKNASAPGAISFANKVNFATGNISISVSICDLDGDGKPDLAVANVRSNTVSIIRQIATPSHRINEGSIAKLAPIAEQAHFVISPNPVESNFISVQLKNQPAGRYTLRLVNNTGQTVFTGLLQHSGGNSTQIVKLPVGTVRGTYQVKLYGVNRDAGTQTIFINTKN